MKPKDEPADPSPETLFLQAETELAFGMDRIPTAAPALSPSGEEDALPAPEDPVLVALERKVKKCTACPLHEKRIQAVFGDGNPEARLMFVGEAPGAEEDRFGLPFVGKAGHLLTRMIEAMGYKREEVYIANVIKCRPPGNRTPTGQEIVSCHAYLEEQIRRISPQVIVALGAPASRTLLKRDQGITALRGRQYPLPDHEEIWVVPTFHPAYLLRNASEKGKGWIDLQIAMKILDATPQ
jgi:uracil-DNA glycosylase family 4